jgi:hypothetical protein
LRLLRKLLLLPQWLHQLLLQLLRIKRLLQEKRGMVLARMDRYQLYRRLKGTGWFPFIKRNKVEAQIEAHLFLWAMNLILMKQD